MVATKTLAVLLLACVAGAAAKPVRQQAMEPEYDSVVDFLTSSTDFNFTSLVDAAVGAGFADALGPDFVGTVFAPTDAAFAAATELASSINLPLTPELLAKILSYHVVNGTVLESKDLKAGDEIEVDTLFGADEPLKIVKEGKKVFLEDAAGQKVQVEKADIKAGDAVVHVIGGVVLPIEPPSAEAPMPSEVEAPAGAAGSVVASAAALAASVLAAALLA